MKRIFVRLGKLGGLDTKRLPKFQTGPELWLKEGPDAQNPKFSKIFGNAQKPSLGHNSAQDGNFGAFLEVKPLYFAVRTSFLQ